MKNFLLFTLVGALVGAVLFALFSPQVISWYFSPPAELAFSCKSAVEWGIEVFRKAMFTGMLLGAIAAVVLFFAARSWRKPAASSTPALKP